MTYTPPPLSPYSPHQAESRGYRLFMVSVAVIVALFIAGIFFSMGAMNRAIIQDELLNRARADIHTINTMRKWNARYGGVFIEKSPDMAPSPYLKDADIYTADGKVLTRKHPALMTREISELLATDDRHSFHITSLKPINPGNVADEKESAALKAFERGETERAWFEEQDGKKYFRYMAPLKVDELCLTCHGAQGYKVGDIRGGISIRFNTDTMEAKLRHTALVITGAAILTILLLLAAIFFFFNQLVKRLAYARQQLDDSATTDALTGTLNRRALLHQFERAVAHAERLKRPLSCILLDLDRFKWVNDQYGNLAGDDILVTMGDLVGEELRRYDLFGRHEGEEFLIVLPDTDLAAATTIAERLRQVAAEKITLPSGEPQTLSIGIATHHPPESAGSIIHRADEALYRAKTSGRNRIEIEG